MLTQIENNPLRCFGTLPDKQCQYAGEERIVAASPLFANDKTRNLKFGTKLNNVMSSGDVQSKILTPANEKGK